MKPLLIHLIAVLARLFARRPGGPLRRVLLIKPDHLGDLLLATPALRALRAGLPDAQIDALVGPWSLRMWKGSPAIDRLEALPFPGFHRATPRTPGAPTQQAASLLGPYLMLVRYALLLRLRRYDAAILLRDDHWWGAALIALAGIPRRLGQAHPLCAPLLSDALPYDPQEHVSAQALASVGALLGAAAGTIFDPRPRFAPTPAEQAWAAGWLAEQLVPGERLLVLHPGTGGPTKHWLAPRWAELANRLASSPGLRLLITGGPGEAALVAEVAGLMRYPVLTLVEQTSVGQLAALYGRAAAVLGVDSGPLHIAVSQGTPTLHLFGPSNAGRFGPWGDTVRHTVLSASLPCAPCGVFSHCPRGTDPPECMAAISVEMAYTAAQRLLA